MRDCVVKLVDDHGVEHSVRVPAESVYEAALKGLNKLTRIGWESDGSQIGWVVVEIYEEPTVHRVHIGVHIGKILGWIESRGRTPVTQMVASSGCHKLKCKIRCQLALKW